MTTIVPPPDTPGTAGGATARGPFALAVREPWFLALLAIPFSAVLFWLFALTLTGGTSVELVRDDYYAAGLAIEHDHLRDQHASAAGLAARLQARAGRLDVELTATDPGFAPPPALEVALNHPARAEHDRRLTLVRQSAPGATPHYAGDLPAMPDGHWRIEIAPADATWRLSGTTRLPGAATTLRAP